MLNRKDLNIFPIILGRKSKDASLSAELDILSSTIRQETEIKKADVNCLYCRQYDHIHEKAPKIYKTKLLKIVNDFDKVVGFKLDTKNQWYLCRLSKSKRKLKCSK